MNDRRRDPERDARREARRTRTARLRMIPIVMVVAAGVLCVAMPFLLGGGSVHSYRAWFWIGGLLIAAPATLGMVHGRPGSPEERT